MKIAVRSFCLFLVFVMTLGLFGCQTTSQQPTQPTTNTTDPNVDPTDPTQGNPPIENLNEKTGLVDKPVILFMGDSITHGARFTLGRDSISQMFEKFLKDDLGRTDDMVKVKGVNIFPSQIDEMIKDIEGASSEYQIMIDHLDGFKSIYMHLSGFSIRNGTNVSAGQQIGLTGNTGVLCHRPTQKKDRKSRAVYCTKEGY